MTIGWSASKRIVGDLDAAERFYAALGFRTLQRIIGGEDDRRVWQEQIYMSPTGDAASHTLILCRYLSYAPPRPEYPGEAWLCFNVADVDAACRAAEQSGGSVFRAGEDRPEHGVRAAVIADPEGHYIELVGPMDGG
jgi:catechol 2,3-dioxygenase-like lactoylglutathione lyase family enzyme